MTRAPAPPLYDAIGVGYADRRRPDPRIAQRLVDALGRAGSVLNVGAGTGSYEPTDRKVVAVEPSPEMIRQRPATATPVTRAVAGALPFADDTFDGALALLTVHHWPDPAAGLAEVRRVTTGPVAVLSFDHGVHARQWLVTEYFPSVLALDGDAPSPARIAEALGGGTVEVVPVPHDCTDGFCHAWWRRPEAYLQPEVRAAISGLARLAPAHIETGVERLRHDLDSGAWRRRHADLLDQTEVDAGYRLVISPGQ